MARDTLSQRPRGAGHWKKQLADAYQRTREMANRLAAVESGVEFRVESMRRERDAADGRAMDMASQLAELQAEAGRRKAHRPMSDAELAALASAVLTEFVASTPARARLIDELIYRGVLKETP